MINTKKVEFVIMLNTALSITLDIPEDEDGNAEICAEDDEAAIELLKRDLINEIASRLNTDNLSFEVSDYYEEGS